MTVAELIAKLTAMPQDLEVFAPMHHPETSGDLIFAAADVGVDWIENYDDEHDIGIIVPSHDPKEDEPEEGPKPSRRQAVLITIG